MEESVAHLVTHLGHDAEGLTREAANKYLSDMGGRVHGEDYGQYGLVTAPEYMYSTGTPEELYKATGGSSWADDLVVFRGAQHPHGIAPHSTIARADEIIERLPSKLIDAYSEKHIPHSRGSHFSATSQSDLRSIFSTIDREQSNRTAQLVPQFLEFVEKDLDSTKEMQYVRDYVESLGELLMEEPTLKLMSGREDSPDDTIRILEDRRSGLEQEMLELNRQDMRVTMRVYSAAEEILRTPYEELRALDSELRGFLPKLEDTHQRYTNTYNEFYGLGERINEIGMSVYGQPFVGDVEANLSEQEFNQFINRNRQAHTSVLDKLGMTETAIGADDLRLANIGQEIDFNFVGDTLRLVRDVERERDDARKRYNKKFLADAEHVAGLFSQADYVGDQFDAIAEQGVLRPGGSEGDLVFFSQGAAYRQAVGYPGMPNIRPSSGFILDGLRMVQDEAVGVRNLVETGWRSGRDLDIHYGERGLDVFRNYLRERPDTIKETDRVVELVGKGEFELAPYLKGMFKEGEVFVKPEYLGEDTSLRLLSGRELPAIQPFRDLPEALKAQQAGRFYRVGSRLEDPFSFKSADIETTSAFVQDYLPELLRSGWGVDMTLAEMDDSELVDPRAIQQHIDSLQHKRFMTLPEGLPENFLWDALYDYLGSELYAGDSTLSIPEGDRYIRRDGIYAMPTFEDAMDYWRGGVTVPESPILSIIEGDPVAVHDDYRDWLLGISGFEEDDAYIGRTHGAAAEVVIDPKKVLGRYDYDLMSGRAGTPIDNTQIPDYADEDGTFYEDYDPRVFDKETFEGAEKFDPAGQASPFEFSEAQKAAIQHGTGRGVVIAGPGSGKTSLLRERLFNLVQRQGVDPQRTLSLTFNRAAADELFERSKDIGDVQVRTVHSYAKQVVEDNLEKLGYRYKPKVAEDEDLFEPFVRRLMKGESEEGFVNERLVREIVSQVDIAKANVTEGVFDPSELKGEARRFATAYETFKQSARKIEFQDYLIQAADLLEREPEIRQKYQSDFDFIQIDEFQDVSQSDWRFLKQLGENLLAVGDDDQTIYSFRSGAGSVMQEFAEDAKQYQVTENFRSTPEIVNLGSKLMEGTRAKRLPKNLTSTRESGELPRYTETTPDTLVSELEKELVPGKENVILVRTRAEKGLLWNILPEALQEHVSDIRTMHSSKGLEFERVLILLNTLERGGGIYRSFPSVQDYSDLDALEEERRLLYVAITRAKDEAVILGREQAFLPELGLTPPPPVADTPVTPAKELLQESKGIRKKFSEAFHRFRAHYQRVRAYQDMVKMERDLPGVEIIENLTDAQVHREKIEELGRQLGLEPTRRTQRPRRLGFLDSLLTLPARPGLVSGVGYAGVAPTSALGLIGGLDPVTQTLFNISPLALVKGLRHIDEKLYPHARRPYQQFGTYRPLHRELPDAIRNLLPEGVDPGDFRVVDARLDDYITTLYEFPHATEGWQGDYAQRPLYHEQGFEMERITKAEADELAKQGLYGENQTYIDTSESSRNVRITPYDPFGGDPYFRPTRPRSPEELSVAAIRHLEEMREFLETSRTSARRPKGLSPRMLDFRFGYGRQHKRLIRPIDRFLGENRGRSIVDFQGLSKLLNRLNYAQTRVSMGSPYGKRDIAGRNVQLHNEVMDLIEDVWNPDSPYYNPAHWTVAQGQLHDLPDGLGQASGDPDNVQRTTPGFMGGATQLPRFGRLRPNFGRFGRRGRGTAALRESSAFIRLMDQAGEVQNIASGVFLGDGYVATVLHSLSDALEAGIDLSGGTAQSLGGAGTFEIQGLRAWDPETELAIFKVAGDTTGLGVAFGGAARPGQRLRTMGIANRAGELRGLGSAQDSQFVVDEPYSSRVTLTGQTDDVLTIQGRDLRLGQSGSPIFDALGRLVGIFGGGNVDASGAGTGFGTPVSQLEPLLAQARALDELGAPVHSLEDIAKLGLPTSEEIKQGYLGRGDTLGLGRMSIEQYIANQIGQGIIPTRRQFLVGEDEIRRVQGARFQRLSTPIVEPEIDFETLTAGLERERLAYPTEELGLSRQRRRGLARRIEKLNRIRQGELERQHRREPRPVPSAATPVPIQSLTGEQLTLDLQGGRDLRSPTGRDRLFGVMEWLDTQGEGTALGYRLQTNIDGSQRLVRDFDIAPRWFGAEPEVPVGDIPTQQALQIDWQGNLVSPVDRPTYSRGFELGADVRNMIETGTFGQRALGRAVAGGVRVGEAVGSRLSGVGQFASRVWRSPVGRVARGGFKKVLLPLEVLDLYEKADYWSGAAFRRLHEPQIAVGQHAAQTRQQLREQFADRPELLAIIESGEIPDWVSPEDRPYIEDAQATYMEAMEGVAQAHAGLVKRRDDLLAERGYWRETQARGGPLRGLGVWGRSPLEREALPVWQSGKGILGNIGQAAMLPLSIWDVAEKGPVSRGIRLLGDPNSVAGIQGIEQQIAEVESVLALPGLADIGMTDAQRERRVALLEQNIAQGVAAREAILRRTNQVSMPLAAGAGHAAYASIDKMAESRAKEERLLEQITEQRGLYENYKTQFESPEYQQLWTEFTRPEPVLDFAGRETGETRELTFKEQYFRGVPEGLDLSVRAGMRDAQYRISDLETEYANLPTVQLRKIESERRENYAELHKIRLQRALEQRLQGQAGSLTPSAIAQPELALVGGGAGMDQVLGSNIEGPSESGFWLPISPIDTSAGAWRTIEAREAWSAAQTPTTTPAGAPPKVPFRVIARTLGHVDIENLRTTEVTGGRKPADYIVVKSLEGIYDGDTLEGKLYSPKLGIRGETEKVRFESIDTPEIQPKEALKYRYHEEYRKPSMVAREAALALEARDLLREKIAADPLNVGRTEDFIVRLNELSGKQDRYGRYLGDVDFTDYDYYEDLLSQGLARVWGSRAKFGDPTTTVYDLRYTESQKDRAKTAYKDAARDMLAADRERLKAGILSPVGEFKERFIGMQETYSLEGLEGDGGFIAEIQGRIQSSQANLERFQSEINTISERLAEARQRMLDAGEDEPRATEQAIKGYRQVLTQSGKLVEGLYKELHKAEVEMIKARESQVLQAAQAQQAELRSVLETQSKARKMLSARLAGDPEYVKSVEGANIVELQGLGTGAKTEYEKYSEQFDKQSGVVNAAFERMTAAGEKFQEDKSAESLVDYEAAKVEYEAEASKLAHLRRLKGLWEQQYQAAESGVQAGEAAIKASEAYVHKQGLMERVESAGADSEYVRSFISAMGESQEGVLDRGLTGAPMQDAYRQLENFEQWYDTFDDRFDTVEGRLQQNIADETARMLGLEDGLAPQYAERERLEAAIKATTDESERAKLLEELGVVEDGIARDEASLKVSEGILEAYLKDAERFDRLLEQVEGQLQTLRERVAKKEGEVLTRSEANEQAHFDRFTGRQQSLIDKGKYDPGYDMFVRSIPKDERTPEQQAYIDQQGREYTSELGEYVAKEGEKDRKKQRQEEERRKRYAERQQLRMQERMLSRVIDPVVSLPGNYYDAWRKQGEIDERGEEQIGDINERLAADIADVQDNNMLSIRQQMQQIEDLEEKAAERRKKIEEDLAEDKKEIWDGVLESFGETLIQMGIKEAEYAASSWLVDKGLEHIFGWEKDGYGGYQRKGGDSSGGGVGDALEYAKVAKGVYDHATGNTGGGDQGGQGSGSDIVDKAGTGLTAGGLIKKGWGKLTGLFGGGEAAATATETTTVATEAATSMPWDALGGLETGATATSGTAATGGTAATTTSPTFGPLKTSLSGAEVGSGKFADSFLGQSLQGAGTAMTGAYLWGELSRDRGSREEHMGQNTNPFLNVLGDASGQLWEGVKGTPGFVAELGGGVWDFAKDIGGFVADIPRTLNETSGTGNWFTQTAKDIGGFFGDTFGKDSWRSVTDFFGFDNTWNDEMAYRAGMRQAQHVDLSSPFAQMGHQSAMDLLEQHEAGYTYAVEDMLRNRVPSSQGSGLDQEVSYRASLRQMQEDYLAAAAEQMEQTPAMNLLKQGHSDLESESADIWSGSVPQGESGGEYAEIVVNVVLEENGRQRRKEQHRQTAKLRRQGVI